MSAVSPILIFLLLVTSGLRAQVIKPFDIVINEIMADPDPAVSILPNYEYVELYNTTPDSINLHNWKFRVGGTVKLLPDIMLPGNSFLVLTSTSGAVAFKGLGFYNVVGLSSFPALTNTGQTLTLETPQGGIISTVTYSDDWYQDETKNDGGYSFEQIDPLNPCGGMNHWRAAIHVNGGTPGTTNSNFKNNPDDIAPQVVRAAVLAEDTILVYFNEMLNPSLILNPLDFSIDHDIGAPLHAMICADFKRVKLTLANTLEKGIIYRLTCNAGIRDCAGNYIEKDYAVRFGIPEAATPNDIIINEILFDPFPDGIDFVEIYNRSNKLIDLKSLRISQYDTLNNAIIAAENISAEEYLMFPQDYLVLSENGPTIKKQYVSTNPLGFLDVDDLPTMSTESGTVCLSTTTDIIDKFIYDEDMHFALLNDTKGISLERIDFNSSTQDRSNWHSAAETVGFATPAYKNSQNLAGIETDNTIEITPKLFSPDEDGREDVVTIHYNLDAPGYIGNINILDSKGRLIKHLVQNELLGVSGGFSWDGIIDSREKAPIGIYIFYVEIFDLQGRVEHYKKTCVLAARL